MTSANDSSGPKIPPASSSFSSHSVNAASRNPRAASNEREPLSSSFQTPQPNNIALPRVRGAYRSESELTTLSVNTPRSSDSSHNRSRNDAPEIPQARHHESNLPRIGSASRASRQTSTRKHFLSPPAISSHGFQGPFAQATQPASHAQKRQKKTPMKESSGEQHVSQPTPSNRQDVLEYGYHSYADGAPQISGHGQPKLKIGAQTGSRDIHDPSKQYEDDPDQDGDQADIDYQNEDSEENDSTKYMTEPGSTGAFSNESLKMPDSWSLTLSYSPHSTP